MELTMIYETLQINKPMVNIQNMLTVLIFMLFSFPNLGSSQDHPINELSFEVNRSYPCITVTKEVINEAHSLIDINKRYEASWVRTYISVEVLTTYKGNIVKSVSENDILSQEQKDMMIRADNGTNISVKVKYMPENTLSHNDPQELGFTFSIDPESEAKYPGGEQQLKKYLKESAIDKIPANTFVDYDLTAIKFTISETGEVTNAHIFGAGYNTSPDEKIDTLLLDAICNMPDWKPAAYSDGTKVKQEFVLTVGNMDNCIINLLNLQANGLPTKG